MKITQSMMAAIALALGLWATSGMAQANQPSQDTAPAGPAAEATPAPIPPDRAANQGAVGEAL